MKGSVDGGGPGTSKTLDERGDVLDQEAPLLKVENLKKYFPVTGGFLGRRQGWLRAVDDVSFTLNPGESLGLVGESGSGKSTTAKAIMRLTEPSAGKVYLGDTDVTAASRRGLLRVRRSMQMVFQDPFASLNPRMSVDDTIAEGLHIHGLYQQVGGHARIRELLDMVGLSMHHAKRYPNEFSGGQRQRIGIARALAVNPKILLLDEPVASLDVSIQAQIIKLLGELQRELQLAYVFVAHDLAVVRHIADRVAVMYLGKIVELGASDEVYDRPAHPYTKALLSAVPIPDPTRRGMKTDIVLEGDVPSPTNPPSGCSFRTRCWKATDKCAGEDPELLPVGGPARIAACHYPEDSGGVS